MAFTACNKDAWPWLSLTKLATAIGCTSGEGWDFWPLRLLIMLQLQYVTANLVAVR